MNNIDTDKYPSRIVVDLLRLIGYAISKTFWFIRYHGRENIPSPSSGPFLIAANHQTYIDPVWVRLLMRHRIRYMAIENAFGWRFIGSLIRYLGAFPVASDASGARAAVKESLRMLRNGASLIIFPEGAREFAAGEMFPFKTGAVSIAVKTGVPILPVTIRGGNRIWPRGQRYPLVFRRVEIIYHPLLYLSAESDENTSPEYWTLKLAEIIRSGYVE